MIVNAKGQQSTRKDLSDSELLELILIELKIMNTHLQIITDEKIKEYDICK